MKLLSAAAMAVVVFGVGCDVVEPRPVSIVLTSGPGEAVSFSGEFGKHEQWEKVDGTTPDTFEFDLADWPACFCLYPAGSPRYAGRQCLG